MEQLKKLRKKAIKDAEIVWINFGGDSMFSLPAFQPDEILIYLRKSRTDDPTLTVAEVLAKHEQMLDEWCEQHLSEPVPECNRFREVCSGETIDARPEMQKVLHLIEQPQYKAVLVVEPQRLSRGDLEDIGRLTKLLRYTGTLVITRQGVFDLTDARDRDYFNRELMRGNDFLEYQKRIMGNGRVLSAENGNYLGSVAPYGYDRTKVREGKRWAHTLAINEAEAEIVRMIFRLYAEGSGATAICTRLNALGHKAKSGARWTPPSIYDMLDNPVYIGMIKWQARKTIKHIRQGEVIVSQPRQKEFRTFQGKHEAIIEPPLWDAVRARRDARTIPRANTSSILQNPFSGIVYCKCGYMMIRRPYNGRCEDRMQCPHMTHCQNASCTMSEMTALVSDLLQRAIDDFRIKLKQGAAERAAEHEEYREQLVQRLRDLEEKETAIWEKYTEGMPRKVFDELLSKNKAERDQTEELLRQADENAPRKIDYLERIAAFTAALNLLHDETATPAQQNELLKRCINRLTYSRERGSRKRADGKRGWDTASIQIQSSLIV